MNGLAARLPSGVRARAEQERGAVAVIVSISLVALLGFAALAIDVSSFYKAQRQAQAAADAGALAAAYDLPFNSPGSTVDGQSVATTNDPDATGVTVAPYNGSTTAVKVTVNATSPSYFGTLFGLTQANISASAVAGGQGSVTQGAIFAYADGGDCSKGINLGTNSDTITGGMQSNGSLLLNTNSSTHLSNGTYGSATSGGVTTKCTYTGSTQQWQNQPVYAPPNAYPIDYRTNLPACTYNAPVANYTYSSALTITSNVVICATGSITVTAGMTLATACAPPAQTTCPGITFEAPQVTINASSVSLSAPVTSGSYGLLFYASGSDPSGCGSALSMSANGSTLNGTSFAPVGTIQISGNSSGTGFIEANNVVFGGSNGSSGCSNGSSGNGFSIIGDGPPVATSGYALLQ